MKKSYNLSYTLTGQAQNRINTLMSKYSPKYSVIIWIASLSCLFIPLLFFRNSFNSIMLSGLFGSAFITFWILNLGLRYAAHKRFSLYYQPELILETRFFQLQDKGILIESSLLKPTFRPYKRIKSITVDNNIIVISGKSGWLEMIPRDSVIEGNCGLTLDELSLKSGKKIRNAD